MRKKRSSKFTTSTLARSRERGEREGEQRRETGRRDPEGSAMSVHVPPRSAPRKVFQERQRLTSLPLYFDGLLSVKRGRQQDFTNYWAELRGTTIFLYADNKQEMHTQIIELMGLNTRADVFPSDGQLTRVTLTLPYEEVQLKAETAEDVEEWKGFILTVTQLSVPSRLALLPGQIIRMHEILEREKMRRVSLPPLPPSPEQGGYLPGQEYTDVLNTHPPCYYEVTRRVAEDMLKEHPECGNLILRTGGDNMNFAVSIRQPSDAPIVKHFKVLITDKGYKIELEKPVTLSSLDKVVEYFMNETRGKLVPYITEPYETKLEVFNSGHEMTETPKKNKPQARVSPQVNLPSKKPERSVELEKPKMTKSPAPAEEKARHRTYVNAHDLPRLKNLAVEENVIGNELKDILTKRRAMMNLAPAPGPSAPVNRKT